MEKVYAKDCLVREVGYKEAEDFIRDNHNQGIARFTFAYGLYYKGELVQLLALGKPRFNKSYKYELIRDCSKKNVQVLGGLSKIWSTILEKVPIRSCIVYTYPYDDNELFSSKYIIHCGFNNMQKAKPERKIYFEGVRDGKFKRIDKSILERHGVDRLLKGSFGCDSTNEQTLLDLGFERKEEDGYSPQIDSYYEFGLVFRIQDLDDGSFYIGMTECRDNWDNGYMGSGSDKWQNHLKKHPNIDNDPDNPEAHHYERIIIRDDFTNPVDTRRTEINEIRKYSELIDGKYVITDLKCKNHKTTSQNSPVVTNIICPECGAKSNKHYKKCSKYSPTKHVCEYCGTPAGGIHKRDCPNYVDPGKCEHCGYSLRSNCHAKNCPLYRKKKVCPECGSENGQHKKDCSFFKPSRACPECGGRSGNHRKECSKFKPRKRPKTLCSECGGIGGHHRSGCSKFKYEKSPDTTCKECGGKNGAHMKTCSRYHRNISKVCPECGGRNGQHRKVCSNYVQCAPCTECGAIRNHYNTCSKYKVNICPECGAKRGRHHKNCSKYVKRKRRRQEH